MRWIDVTFERFGTVFQLIPNGFWDSEYLENGGCGPNKTGDWLIPDFVWRKACQIHDYCYSSAGKIIIEKWQADLLFLINMILIIFQDYQKGKAGKIKTWWRILVACRYFQSVSFFGDRFYV